MALAWRSEFSSAQQQLLKHDLGLPERQPPFAGVSAAPAPQRSREYEYGFCLSFRVGDV